MSAQATTLDVQVGLKGRDQLRLALVLQGELIQDAKLTGVGCPELLQILATWRPKLTGLLSDLPFPSGNSHSEVLLRELLLKAKGQWQFPYSEEQLCHCRAVPTEKVDRAVVSGCHSVAAVSSETSAGTSCGTCKPDIEAILKYRLCSGS